MHVGGLGARPDPRNDKAPHRNGALFIGAIHRVSGSKGRSTLWRCYLDTVNRSHGCQVVSKSGMSLKRVV